MSKKKIILGIDPGSIVTGYGIVVSTGQTVELIAIGHINGEKFDDHFDRLSRIFHRINELIKDFQPDEIAVEAPFYGKNAQSMLKLGRAQGMAIAAAMNAHLPVFEYSPKKIKQSVTGNGNASKLQVASMLRHIMTGRELPDQLDATDGLAVAVCHHFQGNSPVAAATKGSSSQGNSWASFIRNNPDRVK